MGFVFNAPCIGYWGETCLTLLIIKSLNLQYTTLNLRKVEEGQGLPNLEYYNILRHVQKKCSEVMSRSCTQYVQDKVSQGFQIILCNIYIELDC